MPRRVTSSWHHGQKRVSDPDRDGRAASAKRTPAEIAIVQNIYTALGDASRPVTTHEKQVRHRMFQSHSRLSLALEALDVGQGDEVITVAHTFAATAKAIRHCRSGAGFRRSRAFSYTINVRQIERALTANTRAILPVHIFGTLCAVASAGNLLGLWVDRCL